MSLLVLPEEILHHIVLYLAPIEKQKNARFHAYNHTLALLSLSSTCSTLRIICGRYLFGFLSMVRISQLDTLLAPPRRQSLWTRPESLRSAFFAAVADYKWSISHLVCALEIPASGLYGDLRSFSGLKHLQVLSGEICDREPLLPEKLESMAINCDVLMSHRRLMELASRCNRLDLVVDFRSGLELCHLAKYLENGDIRQLNLALSDVYALGYSDLMALLRAVAGGLDKLALRVFDAKPKIPRPKDRAEVQCPNLVDILVQLHLDCFTVDLALLRQLNFPTHPLQKHACRKMVLVDRNLCLSKYMFDMREKVWQMTRALSPEEVHLMYGAMPGHIVALGVACVLLDDLVSHTERRSPVQTVALEQAWSEADERDVRAHYEALQTAYLREGSSGPSCAGLHHKIANASPLERPTVASARFRRRESYNVSEGWPGLPLRKRRGVDLNDTFWDAETSLQDLVYYTTPEKPRSRLWD